MNHYLIFAIGFFAQFLFFARTIVQWFKSEQEGEVISPVLYWQISLLASVLMLTYGIFRKDFSIVLGQVLVYAVYIRNLQLKNAWKTMRPIIRFFSIAIPIVYLLWLIFGENHNFSSIFKNEDIPLFWLIWGTSGQIIFTSRFLYQWIYSENRNDSILPPGFWILSIAGSSVVLVYAVFRLDPVLFISHTFGIFFYIRNIILFFTQKSFFNFDFKKLTSFNLFK